MMKCIHPSIHPVCAVCYLLFWTVKNDQELMLFWTLPFAVRLEDLMISNELGVLNLLFHVWMMILRVVSFTAAAVMDVSSGWMSGYNDLVV